MEIGELGGEAHIWESRLLLDGQAEGLVRQFRARADASYQEILDELAHKCAWLIKKYLDPQAEFLFVPKSTKSLPEGAKPFDIPGTRGTCYDYIAGCFSVMAHCTHSLHYSVDNPYHDVVDAPQHKSIMF